jgi:hypothetical protein
MVDENDEYEDYCMEEEREYRDLQFNDFAYDNRDRGMMR